MILEHAILDVDPARRRDFEAAMAEALPLIAASEGFLGLELRGRDGAPGRYLLLVRWRSAADHREGFRKSERYRQWSRLLHGFYDPFPAVEYYGEPAFSL